MSTPTRIAVIGAGIVGCSCALWLQKKGFAVTLIDPDDPGAGTSSGNACTIAEYGCVPVNSPDLFRRLPSLLFSKDSPLSMDLGYVLSHPAWMIEFLLNCRAQKVARIIRQLGKLLSKVYDGLDPLLDMADARDLLTQNGFMHVYRDQLEFDAAKRANQARREQGTNFVELDQGDIQDLEPNLKIPFERGLLFDSISHVLDPTALCQRYVECFKRNQGQLLRQRALEVIHGTGSVQIRLDNGASIDAERVVIAAGAFSKFIDGIPTRLLKLDTERGYHLQFSNMQHLLSRPVSWQQAGFYATPMNQGMRFAGTVEIAGYKKEKNPRILNYLNRKAHEMLDLPAQPDQEWLGFRPTCPDALPVIGFSTTSEYILYAFGHHHLGLTLSGITGKLIAELANGEEPSHNIAPFSPRRFL
ncbi:MAG: FAD-binding oxidoreductase [Gammaproteobacteria bacterium]